MKKLSYRKMKNLFNPVTGGVEPIKKKKGYDKETCVAGRVCERRVMGIMSSSYLLGTIGHKHMLILSTPVGGCYEPIYKLRNGGSVRLGDLYPVIGLASRCFGSRAPFLSFTPYCLSLRVFLLRLSSPCL